MDFTLHNFNIAINFFVNFKLQVALFVLASIATALAEPPVNYLPPSAQYGAPSRPSSNYGSPGFGGQTTAILKPNAQYGAPSSQYGAPGFGGGYNEYDGPSVSTPQ